MVHPPEVPLRKGPHPFNRHGLLELSACMVVHLMPIPHPLNVEIGRMGIGADERHRMDVVPEKLLETILFRVGDDPETHFLRVGLHRSGNDPLVPRLPLPDVCLIGADKETKLSSTLGKMGTKEPIPASDGWEGDAADLHSLPRLIPSTETPEEHPELLPRELHPREPGNRREGERTTTGSAAIARF